MSRLIAKPGPTDSLIDVADIHVGHASDHQIRTGTTVIVPDTPVAMGVDVRGGGPGTRDTEALNPSCLVESVHGLVLSGGSVFGLAAADAVTQQLSADGIGLPLGPCAVPVVPSAILFDLRNGGDKNWGDSQPYHRLGREALLAARTDNKATQARSGAIGAGTGATAGAIEGGLGTASFTLDQANGPALVVSALVAVNSFGPLTDAAGGAAITPGDIHTPKMGLIGANTTLAAVATNAALDKAGCQRVAIMAHDGLARAIRPLHTPFDGDTVFAMATGAIHPDMPLPSLLTLVGTLAADALMVATKKATAASA